MKAINCTFSWKTPEQIRFHSRWNIPCSVDLSELNNFVHNKIWDRSHQIAFLVVRVERFFSKGENSTTFTFNAENANFTTILSFFCVFAEAIWMKWSVCECVAHFINLSLASFRSRIFIRCFVTMNEKTFLMFSMDPKILKCLEIQLLTTQL